MAKIVVAMSVSVDGFMAGPDGDISWHQVDEELHSFMNELLAPMGAFVEGRRTYELMEEYWPTADQDPTAPGPIVEFAAIWRDTPKVVYSRTLQTVGDNATLVREVVPEEVRALAAAAGGDLAVGGAELLDTFRRLDLVDEYLVFVHPVVVGAGTRMFGPTESRAPLRLLGSRTFGNGVVLLHYGRAAAA